jgi:hypothetical protein
VARRAGTRLGRTRGSLPIWSCSVWGLPCPPHYCDGGALLPHLFTLTPGVAAGAVYFLWRFPSTGFEPRLPDVIRHTALWSSDFPPPPLDAARATVRSSCQRFIIADFGRRSLVVGPSPSAPTLLTFGCRERPRPETEALRSTVHDQRPTTTLSSAGFYPASESSRTRWVVDP